mmetsp:Transcript_98712/g.274740  ORF Transcript_98712/g.274740 Transcript_98712/m.274740 type:complete len:217 (-) Transcript_98712:626-1276(-)
MKGTARSGTPSAKSPCADAGRTEMRLISAAMSRTAALSMPGTRPPGSCVAAAPWRNSRAMDADESGPASPSSSRKASTRGVVQHLSTSSAKASPKRNKLQMAPAERPQRRQFDGFTCRASAATNVSRNAAIFSRNAGRLCPARATFPKVLTASSAALLLERPASISSRAPSRAVDAELGPKRCAARWARSSKPGGSMFSFDSFATASTSSRKCGSG